MIFQTVDRIIFGTLTFPGTRWYVMTVRDPKMVRDQKKFGNHCFICMACLWCWKFSTRYLWLFVSKLPIDLHQR